MASGTITGTTSNSYILSKIEWSSVANRETNTSELTATLYYKRNNTGYTTYGTGVFSIEIGTKKFSETKSASIGTSWVKAMTATATIKHNDDGSCVAGLIGTGKISGTTLTSTNCIGYAELDVIPREATIDSLTCVSSYLNDKLTLKFTPKSECYLRAGFYPVISGSISADVSADKIGKHTAKSSSYSYTFTASRLAWIYEQFTNTREVPIRAVLYTFDNSSYTTPHIGDRQEKDITLTIPWNPDTLPKPSMTVSPVDTPFSGLYVQGKSKVKVTLSGEGKYEATIKSYLISGVDSNVSASSYTSKLLTKSGEIEITGRVTDSRGIYNSMTQPINVIPYAVPKVMPYTGESVVTCERCTSNGILSDTGTCLRIKARRSFSKVVDGDGKQHNFCLIRYRYRAEASKTFSSWVTILADSATSNVVDKTITNVNLDPTTSYVVQVGVVDTIGEADAVQVIVPTSSVTFHLSDNGKRIGIGRYAQDTDEPGVDCDFPIHGGGVDNLTLGTMLMATSTAPISLNDIKEVGNYYSPSADNSAYIENAPYNGDGFSLIVREIQSKNMIRQELFYGRTNWQRHYTASTDTWSEWIRYLMTDYPESTAADFVTETGVYDIDADSYWRYRKWKSGAVDMNGVFNVTPQLMTAGQLGTAGVYYSETIRINLPFSVTDFQFVGSSAAYHCFVSDTNIGDTEDKSIRFRLYCLTDFESLIDPNANHKVFVRIIASGKIKT